MLWPWASDWKFHFACQRPWDGAGVGGVGGAGAVPPCGPSTRLGPAGGVEWVELGWGLGERGRERQGLEN